MMTKRIKNNRKLVNLGLFKNKIVYYDLKEKRLYFSILEKTSKNQFLSICLNNDQNKKSNPLDCSFIDLH